jgi:hypothetical protein
MFKPFLELHKDGNEHSIFELEDKLAKKFHVSEELRNKIKDSGGERLFLNKVRWVKTHMTMAKVVKQTKTNTCIITVRGKEVLEVDPKAITEKFLSRFPEYKEKRGFAIRFERRWAMPNRWTYQIQPIAELIDKEIEGFSIDAFSGMSKVADLRNDLNPDSPSQSHKDSLEFLQALESDCADTVLFDPPYSPRQLSECYKNFGRKVTQKDTQQRTWSQWADQLARITKLGGKAISFGWSSGGLGINRGFTIEAILLVPHGSGHNDTIAVVERKFQRHPTPAVGGMKPASRSF